ncbi:MAG TPA: hypothetical protein VFG84_05475 [Gemmatimonadaceae bacterium]|nr:hypothetical protein [Gemmatimonadaceae bacterium]
MPVVLAATWDDGVFVFADQTRRHELAGRPVNALAPDDRGGVFAVVDGTTLSHRTPDGAWSTIATSDMELACLTVIGGAVYAGGSDSARVIRVSAAGEMQSLNGFENVPGRETWYAGSTVIDGQRVGPPLGIRSMTFTADEAVFLVNVHVGGIPRSTDGGVTWRPTIEVACDVHEVRAHPVDPELVIAASARGLWISRDGGATWAVETDGLHGLHCTAVAFSEADLLVSAAAGHFAAQGVVYRRPIDGGKPLRPVSGLPRSLQGVVDTGCIATRGAAIAVADKGGNLFVSADAGRSWRHLDDGLPMVSALLLS